MNNPLRSFRSSLLSVAQASRFRSLEERVGIVGFAAALIFAMAHSLCAYEGRETDPDRWGAAIANPTSVSTDAPAPSLWDKRSFVEAMANDVGGHRH